jgi:hypothetical protein
VLARLPLTPIAPLDDDQARASTRSVSASVLQMWRSSAGADGAPIVEKEHSEGCAPAVPSRAKLDARETAAIRAKRKPGSPCSPPRSLRRVPMQSAARGRARRASEFRSLRRRSSPAKRRSWTTRFTGAEWVEPHRSSQRVPVKEPSRLQSHRRLLAGRHPRCCLKISVNAELSGCRYPSGHPDGFLAFQVPVGLIPRAVVASWAEAASAARCTS